MKKGIITIIIIMMFSSVTVLASSEVIFEVNGEEQVMAEPITIVMNDETMDFDSPAYIYHSRTIVPMKDLFNALGYDVTWDAKERKVTAIRGDKKLELTIGHSEIMINGEMIVSDINPVIIHDRTYIPLNIVATGTGADVTWNSETRTVSIEQKLDHLNLFYGRSSYNNFIELKEKGEFEKVDSISYAWSRVEVNDGIVSLNTSSSNNNLMYFPKGFEEVVVDDIEKKLLNIYFDGDYETLFAQKSELLEAIKSVINEPESDSPQFEGVVIDFENMGSTYFKDYIQFITVIKESLNNKLVYVAVQPRVDYEYSKLLKVVDRLILMLHDYETKNSEIMIYNNQVIEQPLTPIGFVTSDLEVILNLIDSYSDRSKISLQLSLAVVQWKEEEANIYHRYTPSYNLLIERMKKIKEEAFKYSETYQNPYVVYVDEENQNNTIWYENQRSIQEKIKLAKKYGLGGISLWQIANMPMATAEDLEMSNRLNEFELNIWPTILDNY